MEKKVMKREGHFEVKVEGIDPSTGEVLPFEVFRTQALYVIPQRKKIAQGGWFVMFQSFLRQLARDKDLTGQDHRVLNLMLAELDWENWVQIPQRAIAEELGMPQPKVAKSIKKLSQKGIIEVVRDGRSNRYRINPELVWKGKYAKREEAMGKVVPFKRR
jgi:DNA-binding transcriptional ArsR family regulator